MRFIIYVEPFNYIDPFRVKLSLESYIKNINTGRIETRVYKHESINEVNIDFIDTSNRIYKINIHSYKINEYYAWYVKCYETGKYVYKSPKLYDNKNSKYYNLYLLANKLINLMASR